MTSSKLPESRTHVVLYDADRDIGLEQIDVGHLQDQQLLWIDVECNDAGLVDEIGRRLGLPAAAIAALQRLESTPYLENFGDCFHLQAVAVEHEGALKFNDTVLTLRSLPGTPLPEPAKSFLASADGFSLHAGVAAGADDRKKVERLCRYIARPPIATGR